jgi:protein-disulfide isomerase
MAVLGLLAVVSLRDSDTPIAQPGTPGTSRVAAADPTRQARLAVQRRTPGDPLAIGQLTAPVVISEWGDFQCPFCRAFNADVGPALVRQYVEAGQVRFEWHDLAKLGDESVLAARAARAAARQGAFWPYHDTLYRDQSPENSGALTEASLTDMARSLGLDTARFSRDYADPDIAAQVEQDRQVAAHLGITHVPSFLVNGMSLYGTQPLTAFQQAVDGELNSAH